MRLCGLEMENVRRREGERGGGGGSSAEREKESQIFSPALHRLDDVLHHRESWLSVQTLLEPM